MRWFQNFFRLSERSNQSGFSVVENLVAISILGIASVATVPLITFSFAATGASRNQASILAELEGIIANYQTQPYNTLLQNIDPVIPTIQDGDNASIVQDSTIGDAEFTITFTAIKTTPLGLPDGVRVKVEIVQQRGILHAQTYALETVMMQVS